jgi:large subunit ribosomal protein L25
MSTEILSLSAKTRLAGSRSRANAVRREGRVPGVVYGQGGEGTAVSIDPRQLETILRTATGFNSVFDVSIDGGAPVRCMLKEYQIDSVKRKMTHVDLYSVNPDQLITIQVPVSTVGRSLGERAGGLLQIVARVVRLRCAVKDIPATVPHDVTEANLGDAIYIDQFTPPQGCEFVFRNRFPVIRIARKRGAKGEEATA